MKNFVLGFLTVVLAGAFLIALGLGVDVAKRFLKRHHEKN